MSPPTSFKLNNGGSIPSIGLGTWKSSPGEVAKAVEHALKSGYRHIDGAKAYGNEEEVGQGVKNSGVDRKDVFLCSKLWGTYHDRVEQCLDKTLKDLGTDYLDLYLVHWPCRLRPDDKDSAIPTKADGSRDIDWDWDQAKTWEQMEALVEKGKVKAIGICNSGVPILKHLEKTWKIAPAVVQVEIHPYNPIHYLKEYCDSKGIILEAYSPLGSNDSPILGDPEIAKIAKKHDVQPATVLISWILNRGIVCLPKSVTPSRIESNFKTITLDKEDMEALNAMAEGGKQHRTCTPPWGSDFGFPDWFGPGNKSAPENARLLSTKA